MQTIPRKRTIVAMIVASASVFAPQLLSPGVSAVHAQLACTAASLVGPYAFSLIDFRGPNAASGLLAFDGTGTLSGTFTQSQNGLILQGIQFTGTYTVNDDCTGSTTFISSGGVGHFNFVIDRAGSRLELIQTDSGTVTTGSARQQ